MMGKRSNFPRRERDFYPTPGKAVPSLIPWLKHERIRAFAEPCCGDGDLARCLEASGLVCVYSGDIATGQDALALDDYGEIDAIVTNSPFAKPLMHELIAHFQKIAPTWLLLEWDWSANEHARPFLRSCTDMVPIGRLKWVPNSPYNNGKQNYGWYRFRAGHTSGPVLHPRGSAPDARPSRSCEQCGASYRPQRTDARFCSDACRQRACRSRPKRDIAVTRHWQVTSP